MRRLHRKLLRRQRGAVLVEMALITPILVILIMATAEISRAFIEHNTLTKSIRTGVRYLSANAFQGTTGTIFLTPTLLAETRNLVVYGNVAGTGAPVLPGLTAGNITIVDLGNNNLEVRATYSISGMLGSVLQTYYGGSISMDHMLQASVTMRAL